MTEQIAITTDPRELARAVGPMLRAWEDDGDEGKGPCEVEVSLKAVEGVTISIDSTPSGRWHVGMSVRAAYVGVYAETIDEAIVAAIAYQGAVSCIINRD